MGCGDDDEIARLLALRDETGALLAEGLLSGADARERLAGLPRTIAVLGCAADPRTQVPDPARPAEAWGGWTVAQRR